MTDSLKKAAFAFCHPHNTEARAALAALTPGSTWTTEDGVEVMVVPVEATEAMIRAFNEEYDHELGERFRSAWLAMLSAIIK